MPPRVKALPCTMFTRSLYELSITDDRPVEPAPKCKYMTKAGSFAGKQCTRDAVEESNFCEVCSQNQAHHGVPDCQYMFTRGPNKGLQCSKVAEAGISFCTQCKGRRLAQQLPISVQPSGPVPSTEKKVVSAPSSYTLRFKATKDLSWLRDHRTLTDTILLVDGVQFPAHKLILTIASPYFERLFLSGMKEGSSESIVLKDVSSKTFQLYIDLVYGKEVTIKHWKEAFDLFDYFNLTLLNWSKESAVTAFSVAPDEYVEYIQRLDKIYDDLSEETIKATAKYVNDEMDLSSFDPDFVKLVRPVKIPQMTVMMLGCYLEAKKGLIIKPGPTPGVYVCIGYLPKTTLPSVNGATLLPLTPELEEYCRSLGVTYQPENESFEIILLGVRLQIVQIGSDPILFREVISGFVLIRLATIPLSYQCLGYSTREAPGQIIPLTAELRRDCEELGFSIHESHM